MCAFADKGRDWLRPHAGNHFIARDTPVAAAAAREMKLPLREREEVSEIPRDGDFRKTRHSNKRWFLYLYFSVCVLYRDTNI